MTPAATQRRSDGFSAQSRNHQLRIPLISEGLFRSALIREQKRADRSNQSLALVLVSLPQALEPGSAQLWRSVIEALSAAKRETDALGWFEKHRAIGLLLPEISPTPAFAGDLSDRLRLELSRRLDPETAHRVTIRLQVHAGPLAASGTEGLQPVESMANERGAAEKRRTRYDAAKRVLDVALGATLLAILSPVFLLLAAIVKLTSQGPVFFRQERVGQKMKRFMMLKFRTMRVDSDSTIHHQFVSSFIKSGSRSADLLTTSKAGGGIFKITNDPRVTAIGRFLRRTSLDELPQFWNVLRGDMSLVGPRPPLAYEVEQYQSWHLRRVVEAKPGVTGLWQVTGRSRTTFDEMVRLDLRYARTYSLWTDLKILLATPRAVISGKGAC